MATSFSGEFWGVTLTSGHSSLSWRASSHLSTENMSFKLCVYRELCQTGEGFFFMHPTQFSCIMSFTGKLWLTFRSGMYTGIYIIHTLIPISFSPRTVAKTFLSLGSFGVKSARASRELRRDFHSKIPFIFFVQLWLVYTGTPPGNFFINHHWNNTFTV